MILTDEAIIIYDALNTAFDVQMLGGGLTQRKNTVTGEFTVDRTICPMELCPTLQVTDPNADNVTTDQTFMLAVNWYTVTTSGGTTTETEITSRSSNDPYYLYGKSLIVQANVAPGNSVVLRVKASFVNQHTNQTMQFEKDFVLSTESYVEFNPALEVNIPSYSIVSPFKIIDEGGASDNYLRTVLAKFFAGTQDISTNARMTYVWEKKDGANYRAITGTDVEVVSVSGRQMVLDLRCIGLQKYRVTAYHQDFAQSENRRTVYFTVHRQMSGYRFDTQMRGKYLKKDTRDSECQILVHVNSDLLEDPLKYFTFKWSFYLQNGTAKEGNTLIGFGTSAKVDRSKSGYNRNKVPTFACEPHELSEYVLMTDENNDPIIDDTTGEYIIAQTEITE